MTGGPSPGGAPDEEHLRGHATLVARLEALAATQADVVAVEAGGTGLTYRQLHDRAAEVAARVAAADPAAGPVGVWAPAGSPDAVVGLVGVLAAGRAALVLEPAAPDALLRRWLAAGPVDRILGTGPIDAEVRRRTGGRVLDATTASSDVLAPGARPPGPSAGDAALVVPTTSDEHPLRWSDHAGLAAQARADGDAAGLAVGDRLAVPVPLASGPGRRGVLAGLWAGATVVLRDPGGWPSAELPSWMAQARASVLAATPELVALVDAAGGDVLPGLRTVLLLDGERAPAARPTLRAAPGAAIVSAVEVRTSPVGSPAAVDEPGRNDGRRGHETVREPESEPEPEHPLTLALAAIWEELLDLRPVPRDEDFFALGGYSLLAARMLVLLEQRTGVRLPMSVFLEATTVASLAAAAEAAAARPSHPLVVPLRAGDPTLPPLFLTHDLQGSAWRFRPLADAVGGDQQTYGFESPFLEGRADFPTIEALAAHYVEGVRGVQPTGPYRLAGYSFGGILAFEMARLLRAAGDEVALLGIVDVGPGYRGLDYSRRREPPLPYLRDAVEGAAGHLPRWATPARRLWLNRWVLPWRWRRRVDHGGIVPADQRLWFAWWSHWHLVGPEWAPSPYDGRIDLFWAETTEGTDSTMGWAATGAEVVVHPVPGRHESLMEAPAVDHIGAGLRTRLRAERASR